MQNMVGVVPNVSKCCSGTVAAADQFHIKDVPLPIVTSCRDLGITFSSNLSFSEHIKDIVAKDHQRANMNPVDNNM